MGLGGGQGLGLVVLWVTAQVVAMYAPILSKQLFSLMACALLLITNT